MRELFEALTPYPHTCVWEITARCNLRCIHCASNLGPRSTRGSELSTERALRLCSELVEAGCKHVALSGGEALLRSDWPDLASRLHDLGVRVAMISNGLLVNDRAVKTMMAAGVSILGVSIDGLAPTHDRIRKKEGSFVAATAALRRAAGAGLRVHAITQINRLNVAELESIHHHVESIGVQTWLVQLAAPMGRMRQHLELVLAPSMLPELAKRLAKLRRRSRLYIAIGDNIGYYGPLEPQLRRKAPDSPLPFWCGCTAGFLTVGIEANGNVKGCLSIQSEEFVEGNLTERSFDEIWNSPTAFAYTRVFKPDCLASGCAGCEYGEVCRGGCTFMSVAASGRPHDNPYCLHRLAQVP